MSIGSHIFQYVALNLAILFCCICLTVSSNGKVSIIKLPYVSGEWYWKLHFFYSVSDSMSENAGEMENYTFIPKTTTFNVDSNKAVTSDSQVINIDLAMSTEGSKLQKCTLLLTVEQDKEYFAWTNMTLTYQFAEPLSTSMLSTSETILSTSSAQKFLTRTDEVYVCDTEIPINFGQNVEIVFSSMTFQAFKAEDVIRSDRLREICPRDFKSNIPITALTAESSLHSQQQSLSRQQKFVKDSDISDLVNITQCIELKDSNLNLNSQLSETMNSSSEEFHLPPLNRITVISQDDLHQLCALLEFRGYFLITFTNNDTNERVCYRIPIDLKEEYSSNDDISYIMEKSLYMNTNYTINSIIHNSGNTMNSNDDNSNKSKIPYIEPDNLKIITTNSSCCDNFLRCFTLSFDSNKHVNDLLKDWTIDFYWNRTPEMYEFGEDGWSSVGTPVGALSGVYDLVDVKLKYRFGKNFGLDFSNAENDNKEFIVHSVAEKRLQARVGDYYECTSEIQFIFDKQRNTTGIHFNDTNMNYTKSHDNNWNVIMSLRSVRSQAFADVNVPEFTGASVVCPGDISHDMNISIAIGLSLCTLVVCVLFGLAVNHLRQKDQVFKAVDKTGDHLK